MPRYRNQVEIHDKFREIVEKQPYPIEIDEVKLVIDKGVFPPDAATSTPMMMQAMREFEPQVALDMGCGCGILAIHMRRMGAEIVYAVDRNAAAVECTRANAARNGWNDIRVMQSDLFSAIPPGTRFDMIAFNQFYYPSDIDWFGDSTDGGENVITRFFDEMSPYLAPGAVIVMSFADFAGAANDPAVLARTRGYAVEEIVYVQDQYGKAKVVIVYPTAQLD